MSDLGWVLGAGGLLGGELVAELRRRGSTPVVARLPWHEPVALRSAVAATLADLAGRDQAWTLYWCAGAGVVGTAPEDLAAEADNLQLVLDEVAATRRAPSALFLASSAGGVYAGSDHPPFTEDTPPRALSPYGHAKLDAEARVRAFARATGVPVFIGRIGNLYGPGQSLAKRQGLVSQLCWSMLGGPPTGIYVSLDTRRDYIWAADCASLVVDGARRVADGGRGDVVVKILASGRSVTIGTLLGVLRGLFKRRPNVTLAASPHAAFQARDLGLRSVVWTDLDDRPHIPLPVAMHQVAESIRSGQRAMSSSAHR